MLCCFFLFLLETSMELFRRRNLTQTIPQMVTKPKNCVTEGLRFLLPLNGVMFALQQEYYLLSICLITSMFPSIRSIPNVNRNHVVGIGNKDDISQPQAVVKVKQIRQLHIGCKNILMALSSTEVFVPGRVVLIMKETCSFNDGLFFIWPLCVALSLSSVIVVMLSVFYFLRKANKVESISENTNGYLMDNDAIFFLSTVWVIVRKCIVLLFFFNSTPLHNQR